MPMSKGRQRRLTLGDQGKGLDLTVDELMQGYHYCPEWDDLVISPHETEWGENKEECRCGYTLPFPKLKRK